MIPDSAEVERFLTALCLELTAAGWDQPNLLVPVHADPDGRLETPMIPVHIGDPPSQWLARTAANMAWNPRADIQQLYGLVATPNFAGWLAVTESYGWQGTQEEAAALPPGTRYGDHPDGYESRDLVFVDAGDTTHTCGQIRGAAPEYQRAGMGGLKAIEGGVVQGLRLLAIATAGKMPPGTHRMPPLIHADASKPINVRRMLERMPRLDDATAAAAGGG